MIGVRILLLILFLGSGVLAGDVMIEVSAGKFDRPAGTVVSASAEGIVKGAGAVIIKPGDRIGQVIEGEQTRVVWQLKDRLPAGEKLRFSVSPIEAEGVMQGADNADAIELRQEGQSILKFLKTPSAEAENHEPFYSRTGYIHPLRTPGGKVVTGDYPLDHVHQHALFFAWTRTGFEGRKPEFWNQKQQAGKVSFQELTETTTGTVFCGFSARNRYEDLTAESGPKAVLDEQWTVRAWYSPQGQNYRIVDLEINQSCVGDSPLTIRKYHYGGMAIRGTSQWLAPDKADSPPADMVTSNGDDRLEGNHTRPEWVSMSGPIDGAEAGVTIMAHPSNFRHPQHVRLHPSKPYFVFAPMVEESFQITPDQPYRAKFRLVVQDGKLDKAQMDDLYQQYAEPPATRQITE